MAERKPRVENPSRCIRTRGLAAAIAALRDYGPHASLDRISEIAGCPKASIARVFVSKEALFLAALAEIDRIALQAMRQTAELAGWGRAGVLALAKGAAERARDPAYRGCPINSAGADLAAFPWAAPAICAHKCNVFNLYVEILVVEVGSERAALWARAILLVSDGLFINAAAGFGPLGADAALMAISSMIESA